MNFFGVIDMIPTTKSKFSIGFGSIVSIILLAACLPVTAVLTGCRVTYTHRVKLSPKLVETETKKEKVSETLDLSDLRLAIVEKPTAENPMLSIRAEAKVVEHYEVMDTYRECHQQTTVTVAAGSHLSLSFYLLHILVLKGIWDPIVNYSLAHNRAKSHAIAGVPTHTGSPCNVCGRWDYAGDNFLQTKYVIEKFDKRELLGDPYTKKRQTKEKTTRYKPVNKIGLKFLLDGTFIWDYKSTGLNGVCSFDISSLLAKVQMPWKGEIIVTSIEYPHARVSLTLTEKDVIKIITSVKK